MQGHIRRLRYCFEYMLESIIDTLRKIIHDGWRPDIAIELPENNWYWSQPQLLGFCSEFNLIPYNFHGCMYGLAAQSGPGKGLLLKKGWCVATNQATIGNALQVKCNHDRSRHTPVQGELTKSTEEYPELMVNWIHYAFNEANGSRSKGRNAWSTGQSL